MQWLASVVLPGTGQDLELPSSLHCLLSLDGDCQSGEFRGGIQSRAGVTSQFYLTLLLPKLERVCVLPGELVNRRV